MSGARRQSWLPAVVDSFRFGAAPSYTGTITVPSGRVSADLSAFPVMVDLSTLPAGFWAAVSAGGANVRVAAGPTVLPLDVVAIDIPGNTGYLFFRANLLAASNNVFTLTCTPGFTAAAVADPTGRNAVWSSYNRAWSFWGESAVDRTGNGSDVSFTGTAGFLTGGLTVPVSVGASAFASVGRLATYTLSVHHAAGVFALTNDEFLSYGRAADRYADTALLLWRATGTSYAMWNPVDQYTNGLGPSESPMTPNHIALSQASGTRRRLWTGGVLRTTDSSITDYPTSSSGTRLWFNCSDASGASDNTPRLTRTVGLRSVESPAEWIAAENASWVGPGTFYTVGA